VVETTAPAPVLATWSHQPDRDARVVVLPDGCRDLILRKNAAGEPHWFISPLADASQEVECRAGEQFVGYRLRPGARMPTDELLQALAGETQGAAALPLLAACVRLDENLTEVLDTLAEAVSVAAARRALGVSERSLERLLASATGRPPGYWKSLARVRRLARALPGDWPLIELAGLLGYADQAHMNRECRRWFGLSPGALRRRHELLALAAEPGYGDQPFKLAVRSG